MIKTVTFETGTGNKKVLSFGFQAQRPFIQDSPNRKEFTEHGTRYYDVDGRIFDANTYDKLMGIGRDRTKILSNKEALAAGRSVKYRQTKENESKRKINVNGKKRKPNFRNKNKPHQE